jgi:hypothetical protein
MARARRKKASKHHARTIGPHPSASSKPGACPECGGWHDRSQHWSHRRKADVGHWYGRAKRPQGSHTARGHGRHAYGKGRRAAPAPGAFAEHAELIRRGKKRPARAKTTRAMALAEARRIRRGEHPTVKPLRRGKKHRVAEHLAKNPRHAGKHRVRGHLAAMPHHHAAKTRKTTHKKRRSPAQIAATKKMLAAAKKRRGR